MTLFNLIFVFYSIISSPSYIFLQNEIVKKPNQIKILSKDINWTQILSNDQNTYAIGKKDDEYIVYNFSKNVTLRIKVNKSVHQAFLNNDFIYFGSMQSSNGTYEVLVYHLNKKLNNIIKINNSETILGYFTQPSNNIFYYFTINLDSFMSGKSNGKISCSLFNSINEKNIIAFEYEQLSFPSRITLPIGTFKDEKIFVAIDNKYKIDIYSTSAKKIFSIDNKEYINKPYTKKEFDFLSPIQQSVVSIGKSYPPIINKINLDENENIYITRYKRPGERFLKIDNFDFDGRHIKTFSLELEENEKLIDSILSNEFIYYCLLDTGESNFILKVFDFN